MRMILYARLARSATDGGEWIMQQGLRLSYFGSGRASISLLLLLLFGIVVAAILLGRNLTVR